MNHEPSLFTTGHQLGRVTMNIKFSEQVTANEFDTSITGKFTVSDTPVFEFGRFVVSPACRTLLLDGKDVCIGARAFDLLVLLLQSSGRVVSKDLIMRHVWPSTTVDECNLRFQITSLRKALGEERVRIKTVTGRGYLFVAEAVGILPSPSHFRKGETLTAGAVPINRPAILIIDKDPENRVALQRLLQPFAAEIRSYPSMQALREGGLDG